MYAQMLSLYPGIMYMSWDDVLGQRRSFSPACDNHGASATVYVHTEIARLKVKLS